MNERLATYILTQIRNGIQGYQDILISAKSTETFFALKDEEFSKTINELKELDCIRNLSVGHPKTYILNNERNCLNYYEQRVNEEINSKDLEDEFKKLQIENIKLSTKVLTLQIGEIKNKIIYILIGAAAATLFTLIGKIAG